MVSANADVLKSMMRDDSFAAKVMNTDSSLNRGTEKSGRLITLRPTSALVKQAAPDNDAFRKSVMRHTFRRDDLLVNQPTEAKIPVWR